MTIIREGKAIVLTEDEVREAHALYEQLLGLNKIKQRITIQQHLDHFLSDQEFNCLINNIRFLNDVLQRYNNPPYWCENDDESLIFAVNETKKKYL